MYMYIQNHYYMYVHACSSDEGATQLHNVYSVPCLGYMPTSAATTTVCLHTGMTGRLQ